MSPPRPEKPMSRTRKGLPSLAAVSRAFAGARATPDVRRAARAIARRCASCEARDVAELALALHARGHRWWACEILEASPRARSEMRVHEIEALARGLDSWSEVDVFACFVAGPCWREGRLSDAHIARWARSMDRWLRRLALVATVPLNLRSRGGEGGARRTLAVCARLVGDRDDMVVKALSWALRELGKRDPRSVRAFLAAHRDRLARRVVREVETKLATGLKQPRRR
jgi:3-methyladenine DNA glycosylase AlkD